MDLLPKNAWFAPALRPSSGRVVRAGAGPYKRAAFEKVCSMSESARFNMIEAQIRSANVTDSRILAAMNAVPREKFVPSAARALAYADVPVAVAPGRYLLDPRSFAKLAQLAGIGPTDRVLDVGCATGYCSAVLARLAGAVVALEQGADVVRLARKL